MSYEINEDNCIDVNIGHQYGEKLSFNLFDEKEIELTPGFVVKRYVACVSSEGNSRNIDSYLESYFPMLQLTHDDMLFDEKVYKPVKRGNLNIVKLLKAQNRLLNKCLFESDVVFVDDPSKDYIRKIKLTKTKKLTAAKLIKLSKMKEADVFNIKVCPSTKTVILDP
jgi:hypothetical protein